MRRIIYKVNKNPLSPSESIWFVEKSDHKWVGSASYSDADAEDMQAISSNIYGEECEICEIEDPFDITNGDPIFDLYDLKNTIYDLEHKFTPLDLFDIDNCAVEIVDELPLPRYTNDHTVYVNRNSEDLNKYSEAWIVLEKDYNNKTVICVWYDIKNNAIKIRE